MSLLMDSRTNRSSSTIDTNDAFGIPLRQCNSSPAWGDPTNVIVPTCEFRGNQCQECYPQMMPVTHTVPTVYQTWSTSGARKRDSASSPPQHAAGAGAEAICLGLARIDHPPHNEPCSCGSFGTKLGRKRSAAALAHAERALPWILGHQSLRSLAQTRALW